MRNLTMLMDFYELTMANGYFVKGYKDTWAVFDMFYRKNPDNGGYVICAGLEQLIEYVQNMHFSEDDIKYLESKKIFDKGFLDYLRDFHFTGTIEAVPEGTVVYPNTPLVTVTAPVIEAQLMETMLLICINFQSLIATKASRICLAAGDNVIMEFGARRAQGPDAAIYGARACYIGGVNATATAIADINYGVPAIGTMAHSWIQFFPSEYESFKAYAEVFPDTCTLLIDTYDILNSGLPNAIRVAHEVLEPMGKRLKGVRIDSGDLAYFSKKIRKKLDEEGLSDCKIVVSNSVDEYLIDSLNRQGAKINSYGVGERMITSKSDPVFGGVYKLAAVEDTTGSVNGDEKLFIPKIKISENVEKITNPGKKKLWRIYSKETGYGLADMLTLSDEVIDGDGVTPFVDESKPWKKMRFKNVIAKPLQVKIFENGKLVYDIPKLEEIRELVKYQLENTVWQEEQRFANPHAHYLDLSEKLYKIKTDLLSLSESSDQ
ncbi:nicotinate phosphoribosyltransferase [Eubacterium ruminantium]|uniref:Nicotinate phosphoribosyltransferase n=1 Tax=Eubacterium ruminantium TaxID=42322 RepID=A0A1T4PBG4_9FIRM|nr:nicotinate phosphoribosyltransferase [Eubacterium ruminantium]SCW58423.1 nicotinate phosphoribosyltransferase [Eubacterium ruminantium]SDM98989.1 nicotinate phosphoribosyltransferase [Eubacterium ruminantium]SJZ88721.1 nicotinate phosphoribosyltransferase [Eubacterium ruminantium]